MNIYDIAAEAGTSISTVSRVLNNKGNVNPQIRKRVEEVLKKYDYKPSAIARGMVSKTMKSIAILTVDVRVTHYARMIYVIEQEFTKGSNWHLGSGLSLVLMVFILISMAMIAKYDKNGEGTAF